VTGEGDLSSALDGYRRAFRRRMLPHYVQIVDFASGRKLRANERAGMRVAAGDPDFARAMEEVTSRRRSPLTLFHPRFLPRMLRGLIIDQTTHQSGGAA
jgi:hypothetical protein